MATVFWTNSLGVDVAHQTVILSPCQVSTRSRWHSGKPPGALFWGEEGAEWHVFGTTGNVVLRRLNEKWTRFLSPSNNQLENIKGGNTPLHNSHKNIKYLGLNSVEKYELDNVTLGAMLGLVTIPLRPIEVLDKVGTSHMSTESAVHTKGLTKRS